MMRWKMENSYYQLAKKTLDFINNDDSDHDDIDFYQMKDKKIVIK